MSTANKGRSLPLFPVWLKNLAKLLWGPGWVPAAIVLLVAVLSITATLVWAGVKGRVLASERYRLTQQDVRTTPPPTWIHSDVRAEVFRNASLDGPLSILNDDLAERIANAFALHPWIARVVRVTKQAAGQVDVELVYRQPACLIELPGDLLPVDVEGTLLPNGDFSPIEKQSYPCLAGIDTRPMGPVGQRWGDARVVDGAEIAAALAPIWQQLRLYRIVVSPRPAAATGEEHSYDLYTCAGTRIVWGFAPRTKVPGEMPAADKVARLAQYLADHNTLEGTAGPQVLDVHTLPAPRKR